MKADFSSLNILLICTIRVLFTVHTRYGWMLVYQTE